MDIDTGTKPMRKFLKVQYYKAVIVASSAKWSYFDLCGSQPKDI